MAEQYTPTPVAARETRTLSEVAQILGISVRSTGTLTRAGRIKTVRLGKRVLVPCVEIDRILGRDLADRSASAQEQR